MENEKGFFERQKKWIIGGILLLALIGFGIFFFSFYKVTNITVMESNYYTQDEIREMILDGPFTDNSVLAPILYSKDGINNIPFVKGYSVTALSHDTLCITLKEEVPVGCVPYLDNYVYFSREGVFTESSLERDKKVPFFAGLQLDYVIKGEELPVAGKNVFNTAIALASIFRKNDQIPDYIEFDSANNISLIYGDIIVQLGKDQYLEDKMARVLAILPKLQGEKGILHIENLTDNMKTITFERELEEITAENWPGGYDKEGNYTGDGEYDSNGKYVGPKPMTEYDYAIEAWPGGYDEEGDFTGRGVYDKDGEYVGEPPTRESIEAQGDWHGGYDEHGRYITIGEYDRNGEYVGPNPNADPSEERPEKEDSEEEYDEEEYDYDEDYDYSDESEDYEDEYEEYYNEDDYDSWEDYDEDEEW